MILVTGGAYQGKGAFAEQLKADGLGDVVVEHIHEIIGEAISGEKDPRCEIRAFLEAHPNGIFTVNELGCGIVPMTAFDRNWRETTGRICCELAREAEAVYRVVCGIGTRIK